MYGSNVLSDVKKIGVGLVGFGVLFLFLGVLLLFDSALLALGNVLLLAGLGCIIGIKGTYSFFFKSTSYRGALFFLTGLCVVFFGYPVIGMLLETYGLFNLLRTFMPVIIKFLYGVPLIGWILWLPGINRIVTWLGGQSNSMV
ncbi:Vesicle transport protein GOT1B [Fasciola hepatica]|uniref:Vesicle transport protein GOT1B n=2 Tax=Fasciola TaxID=6191 RepID=A0A4E0RY37_FASHE|nr:Vesicle transport protein GOT1B [Fasciola hepatica]